VTQLTRRSFLKAAATTGAAATASGLISSRAWASPILWKQPGATGASVADQIHIAYGADAASQMTVSWHTATSVSHPRMRLGTMHGGWGRVIPAETRSYVDGINRIETICQHARAAGLAPGTTYMYEVLADGAAPVQGSFTTAPSGRVPFRFTSVGDLATPNTKWSKSSLNAATTVHQVQQFNPMFHLHNGDLSYANDNESSQPQVWTDFMNNIQNAATYIPWMTALGNHESEWANGPLGYASYHTRFDPPDNGSRVRGWQGNWYTFQVGSALFVSLDANDVHYANDGSADPAKPTRGLYIAGYSHGAQKAWLERTLAAAHRDSSIDWIIAFHHQPIMSSSSKGAGGDLGIRRAFLPSFDAYGVDLVLCGHDHDYERTYVVHGTDPGTAMRPTVVSTSLTSIDSSLGHLHMVIGGGGTSSHDDVYGKDTMGSNPVYGGDPIAQVYLDAPTDEVFGASATGREVGTWSAVRDPDKVHPWGIATFDLDPGDRPGGQTSISVNFYHTPAATAVMRYPAPILFDSFTMTKQRRDAVLDGQVRRERILIST
jgi:Calcineurin-like phosphoesterase/Purple acid Phosphatase, N-terminal domain/TAT (twin-arginine translocation) pathway signal sequence